MAVEKMLLAVHDLLMLKDLLVVGSFSAGWWVLEK